MPPEATPQSPIYLGYLYRTPEPAASPSAGMLLGSGARHRPYQPASQLTQTDIDLTFARGVYDHFHAPTNDHNRFLVAVPDKFKAAYRSIERMAPPPFDKSGRDSMRPASAPHMRSRGSTSFEAKARASASMRHNTGATTLLDNMTTTTGAPCYLVPAVIDADMEEGKPLSYGTEGTEAWRVARVQTYVVPPSRTGYGEGGCRPFHQDYRHYKYYGFAGKGAKTSWAHNPKYNEAHSYSQEGTPSRTELRQGVSGRRGVGDGGNMSTTPRSPTFMGRPTEIIDPYMETVSVITRQTLSPGERRDHSNDVDRARVATYRQPAPGELTLTENPSPNHGSQSPFHQRYMHYKHHGFAGKGATSSWARNPKYALLNDHQ